jgi:hypothetical protein
VDEHQSERDVSKDFVHSSIASPVSKHAGKRSRLLITAIDDEAR